jgi:preprotein translocase subunit SecG
MQRGRGDVGSAFGGMGQGVFGPGGVDTILTKATYWLGFMLMGIALLISFFHLQRGALCWKMKVKDLILRPSKVSQRDRQLLLAHLLRVKAPELYLKMEDEVPLQLSGRV